VIVFMTPNWGLIVLALVAAAVLAGVLTPLYTSLLRKAQLGQVIRPEGPQDHHAKAGTPTGAGVAIAVAATVPAVLLVPRSEGLVVALALAGGTLLGLMDDRGSMLNLGARGLRTRSKLPLEVAGALILTFLLVRASEGAIQHWPLTGQFIDLGPLIYPLGVLVIVGSINGVNFTDGSDGLAASVLLVLLACLGVLAVWRANGEAALWCAALGGALLGFLPWNWHPARVFMGDAGAIGLGAAVGTLTLALGAWWLLIPAGIVLVAETLSVVAQVLYFKSTGGRRLLRMSPLHHHFALGGWGERRLALSFAAAGVVGGGAALVLARATGF
jgi:phospho-N-acetylmuramoyl-pentapeptide-transferase